MAAWFGSAFGLVPARTSSQASFKPPGSTLQLSFSSSSSSTSSISTSPAVSLPSVSLLTTGTQASKLSETLPAPRRLSTPYPQRVPTLEQLAECSLSGLVSSDLLSVSALNVSAFQDPRGPMDVAIDFHVSLLMHQVFLHFRSLHARYRTIGNELQMIHTLNMKTFWFQQVQVATILSSRERICTELSETLLLRRVFTRLIQALQQRLEHRRLAEESRGAFLCRRTWSSLRLKYLRLNDTETLLVTQKRIRLLHVFFDILLWKAHRYQACFRDSELLYRRRLYERAFHDLLRLHTKISSLQVSVTRRLLGLAFSAWQYGFLAALKRNVLALSYSNESPRRHLGLLFDLWRRRATLKRLFSRWFLVSRARRVLHKHVRLRRCLEMRHPKTQVVCAAFLEYLHMRIKINRTVRRLGEMRCLKRAMTGWRSRFIANKKLTQKPVLPVQILDHSPLLSSLPVDISDRSARIPLSLRAISPIDLPISPPPSPTPGPSLHSVEAGIQVGSKAALYAETKEYVYNVLEGRIPPRSQTIDQIVERYCRTPLSDHSAPNAPSLPSSFGSITIPIQYPQAASGLTDPASPSAFAPSFLQVRDRFVASDPPRRFEGSGFLSMPDPEQYIVSGYEMLTARYDLVGSFDNALKKHFRAMSAPRSPHTE
ncbi:hypothetical protein GMRT_11149 [Giardia muris]|uniref:Uncharacterized protein n=1 Tax=Giardia muris TaxID=5742 RepID=A0A4Z1SUK0_GIAMU|nr:hypothetical protein GMRT_11149 [Giardia muris]|eukprot:TNJ29380.1 hypothetical protein GMRT_11149 [Giardia muris]